MKTKATKKLISALYGNIIKIGYCDLQYLLMHESPVYYTEGVYGHNADIYIIDTDTIICTGSRPFGNIKPAAEVAKKYNDAAKEIMKKHLTYEEETQKIDLLLKLFVNYVTEGNDEK